jgi:hypothetical protein
MPTIKEAVLELEEYFKQIQGFEALKAQLRRESFRDEERYEARKRSYDDEVRKCRREMETILKELDRMPERHHLRHWSKIQEFWQVGKFEESVFIMTKYPDQKDGERATQLQKVIDIVSSGISARGFRPRMASDQVLQRWLWDNVELYLFGCARGVAIVEDRYLKELNPNVAMEWGWMTAMGRDVLFLREASFTHARADWKGLNEFTFDWTDPSAGVNAALDQFLRKP